METPAQDSVLQPGQDSSSRDQSLHQGVAANLSSAIGETVSPQNLVPVALQTPVVDQPLAGKPGINLDIEDIMAGEQGRPRTEPSNRFLKMFLERLGKKNPEKDIQKEE